MPITTCAKPPWLMTHLRRRSMIPNAMASAAAALVYMNIGTMGGTRSTRAISGKRTGSNFSRPAEVQVTLEPPVMRRSSAIGGHLLAHRAAALLARLRMAATYRAFDTCAWHYGTEGLRE